ncbi:MAG: DUF120 domain-containing protein [Candidatus Bathyarchaeia archaeon]
MLKDLELLPVLLKLLELGAHKAAVDVTTRQLAQLTSISQQTASRRLAALEAESLVSREITSRGQRVKISPEGIRSLTELYMSLQAALQGPRRLAFKGRVFTGIGDGRYYMRVYRRIFEQKLGFTPFLGTLNLRLSTNEDLRTVQEARMRPGIEIREFTAGDRRFGSGKCILVTVNGAVKGAIVFPQRTHYGPDVVELIASVNLREALSLRDGDEVSVEVTG